MYTKLVPELVMGWGIMSGEAQTRLVHLTLQDKRQVLFIDLLPHVFYVIPVEKRTIKAIQELC